MKKTKGNRTRDIPQATQPKIQAPENVQETNEERQARADRASAAIREVLKKEGCIIMVPTLDISSGRVIPRIEISTRPLT